MSFIASLSLVIVAALISGSSCGRTSARDYDIDKTSPNGLYRVKIEIRAIPPKGTREYTEQSIIKFFRGQEIIYTYESEDSDQYELTFRETKPVVEWIDDAVLRMGEDRSNQPFSDELTVSNNTDEYLKYMSVGYGRFELFWVFDLAPGTQATLSASPRFKPDGTSNSFLGYGGTTRSGKKFQGTIDGRERRSPADGPLKFAITVTPKDLH